jgi:hypothetical protein
MATVGVERSASVDVLSARKNIPYLALENLENLF